MTDRSFDVVPATPADLPAIVRLIRGLAEYERLTDLCVASETDIGTALFGPHPAAEALITRERGPRAEARGFALFFQTFSTFLGRPTLWLEDLFVEPEARGLGMGAALLRALATEARARNCGRFEWAVLEWNADAIRFYEAIGARVLPEWRICRVSGAALDRLAEGNDAPPAMR